MKKMFVLSASCADGIEIEPIAILTNLYEYKIREVIEDYLVELGYSRKNDKRWFDEIVNALCDNESYNDWDGESEVRFIINEVDVY